MEDLGKLIKECAAGKSWAQARIYELFSPKMFGVCLRYSKDYTEAEDNLQEGFLRVFEKIGTFRHEGSFEGWIRRIMVNVSLEKFRKQNILLPVEDMSGYEEVQFSDDVIARLSAQELMDIIRELPPRYKMVFNLYVFEGMNHKDIAAEMNITEGTSKSNLARARMILKKRIAKEFGEMENNFSAC